MRKRVLGTVLVALLLATQALGVSASKRAEIVTETSGYIIEPRPTEFTNDDDLDQTTADTIDQFNGGSLTSAQFIERAVPQFESNLSGYVPATRIVDVHDVNGGTPKADGTHDVTFSGVGIKAGTTVDDVYGLHFKDGSWEIKRPVAIDVASNQVTFNFESFSPFVIYVKESVSDTFVGTSPKTGAESAWILWFAAAAVLAGVSAGVIRRERRAR